MSKKGRTLMVFATVSGDPTEKETEEITGLWQGSLFNANFDIQRYFLTNLFSFCIASFQEGRWTRCFGLQFMSVDALVQWDCR